MWRRYIPAGLGRLALQDLLRFLSYRLRRKRVKHLSCLRLHRHDRQRDIVHQAVGRVVVIDIIRRKLPSKQDAEPLDHRVQGFWDGQFLIRKVLTFRYREC